MLDETQVRQFRQQGFLLGGRVLSDDQVERLRTDLARVIAERERKDRKQPVLLHNMTGREDSAIWQIVNIYEASDAFRELVFNSRIVEETAQLAGARQLRIWHDQVQYKPAGQGGVNMWHQDAPYWQVLRPQDQMVTAWIALDDVDDGNGCMSMVGSSHLWGNQIEFLHSLKGDFEAMPKEFSGHEVRVESRPVAKGQVHYHHSLTWHGSRANKSGRPRRAIALHYMTEQTRYVAKETHLMKQFVTVKDGEMMAGERFPVVWPQ